MALQTISESVYVGLCLKIGSPQQIVIRRELVDIKEFLRHKVIRTYELARMESGSCREGFRFSDSDLDYMYWLNNYRVFWDFSQAMLHNTNRQVLILCDSSESPPGFTLLWLPLEESTVLISSCVRMNGALCISSAKFRENTCILLHLDLTVHGPCSSGRFGPFEFDNAICFVSEFWPPSASSWIYRCHSWPPPLVVNDIVNSGCHFVAIGHKLRNHADNEWRISFSQAEQKLVYAMNHTQFLTYGLLKLFVKDFNKGLHEDEKLLCSYHMKTTIFWTIQNTITQWCPQNLLAEFWVCFKLLLKWVYEGVCPNFFIPENNMFLTKVQEEAQKKLFTRLYSLYEKGIAFLLHIPSISSYIMDVLCNPKISICTDESTLISEVMIDRELFQEMNSIDDIPFDNLHRCMTFLNTVEHLMRSSLTECQIIMLQKYTATVLQTSAFMLHDIYTNTSVGNKQMYIANKMACYMLMFAAKFSAVSDLLYISMYYYKTFRHREALSILEMIKVKLAQPGLMVNGYVDPERYTEAVGEQSWSTKIRHTMLEFLCYRQVDPVRAQDAIDDLHLLIHHDQGILVPVEFRDISWEILGICQQMTGNHQSALYSYHQSLTQLPLNRIQSVTRHRSQDLN